MKRIVSLTVISIVALLGLTLSATAGGPGLINYQGYLEENNNPVNGNRDMTFKIYDAETAGSIIWSEAHTYNIKVTEGVFDTVLGYYNPIDDGDFSSDQRWLEVTVAGQVISPRTRLTTAPYAFRVNTVDGATGGTIWGNVGIGMTPSIAKLDVSADTSAGIVGRSYRGETGLEYSAGVAGLNYSGGPGGPGVFGFSNSFHAISGWNSNPNAAIFGLNYGTGPGIRAQNQGTGPAFEGYAAAGDLLRLYNLYKSGADLRFSVSNNGDLTTVGKATISGTCEVGGIKMSTGASNGYVLTSDATGVGTWQTAGGGGGGWVDDGTVVRLQTGTDSVGIGTASPTQKLDVSGNIHASGSISSYSPLKVRGQPASLELGYGPVVSNAYGKIDFMNYFYLGDPHLDAQIMCDLQNRLQIYADSDIIINTNDRVGIGTIAPEAKLHVYDDNQAARFESYQQSPTVEIKNYATGGAGLEVFGTVAIAQANPGDTVLWCLGEGYETALLVRSNGHTSTPVLEITGGSDLSEQFEVRHSRANSIPSPGMVVCIDPEHPGELTVATMAYDRTVAGVVSGAGGVAPGMLMSQKGSVADGKYPVALTGRVWCLADASYGAIRPGDFLTTSDTPGHAMKAVDRERAYGAVIGKAMTSLESGQGLVLVLVNLQ
jgi:hypothetical protein